MSAHHLTRRSLLLALLAVALVGSGVQSAAAGEILVSDRINRAIYRYSDSGAYLGILVQDSNLLNYPSGMAVSPDNTKLYVTATQSGKVIVYDYDYAGGSVSNPQEFATGLAFPNSIVFNPDGDRIYVSQLNGGGVRQYNLDGSSAGAAITGGSAAQLSGLAFNSAGELLVGGFLAGAGGSVARSNAAISSLSDLVAPTSTLTGVGNMLVYGDDLYVTAGFVNRLNRYDALTGAVDNAGFTPATNLEFPASILLAPDGNGILVGELGIADGGGQITRFGFDGANLGLFIDASIIPANGFGEATGMLYVVPEPSSMVLAGIGLIGLAFAARRRRQR